MKVTASRSLSLVSTTFVLAMAATSAAAQGILAQHGEIVQAVGDAVPGIPGATIFATSNFDAPVMDQNGTLVYRARMTGGGLSGTDDRAYFIGRASGDLQIAVQAGTQAPGCLAGTLLRSSSATTGSAGLGGSVRISPFGEILFFSSSLWDPITTTNTPATSDSALFWGPVGGINLLAREGEQVTFLGAGVFYGSQALSLQNNGINAGGTVVFETTLSGAVTTGDDACMLTGVPGGLTIVSREGDVMPGGEVVIGVSGNTMSFVKQINESGQILHEMRFSTTLGTPPATTLNDRAVAIWTPGSGDTILAREGDQAPGLPAGVLFATPTGGWALNTGGATFTKSGKTAFNAQLDGGGTVVGVDDYAVYHGGIGSLNVAMRKGDVAPGTGGATFGNIGNSSLTCNETQVAFVGFLVAGSGTPAVTTASDSGIWFGTPGNLTLLVREGDTVPTTILPVSPNGPWIYQSMSAGTNNPLLNERGDLVVQVAASDSVNYRQFYLCYTPALGVRVLLDAGENFTTILGTAPWTGLSSNAGYNSGDGGQAMFNNQGDVCFRPSLTGAPTAAILRGHVGSFLAKSSSVPVAGGVPQNFVIDCGPAHPYEFYIVLATSLGTRPGFLSPLGGGHVVPLNWDTVWSQLSFDLANSPVWLNTIGITDASGKGIGASGFVMPPGYAGFQGITLHHAAVLFNSSLVDTFVTEPSALKMY